jgi:hypothetical protein
MKRHRHWFGPTIPCALLGAIVGSLLPLSFGSMAPISGAVIGFLAGLIWDSHLTNG